MRHLALPGGDLRLMDFWSQAAYMDTLSLSLSQKKKHIWTNEVISMHGTICMTLSIRGLFDSQEY